VQITRDAVSSTLPFYVDGVQFEQESKATTFIHGYEPGCRWTGAARNSSSYRPGTTAAGGELICINDYAKVITSYGLGMGDWNQIMTKMTSGGDMYQTHIRKSRNFTLVLAYSGDNQGDLQANRKVILDALRPDLAEGQTRIIRYQGFDANGNEATNPIDIHCVFQPSHNDIPDMPVYQREMLNFTIPSGLLDGAYEEGGELNLYAEFAANYIVRRDPNGRWCEWNGSAYVNPLAGVTGGNITDIKEAPNGDIYVCGAFTGVSNGGNAVPNTKGIARWSKVNQIWEAVGDPNTGATIDWIWCMIFDANGDLYIGGKFTNLANIANADNFAKYTVSNNTWSAIGSGINDSVYAIEIEPNGTIYIGGLFTEASGNVNCKRIAYWSGSAWAPLSTGLIEYVRDLKFAPDGKLLIAGAFNSAGGTGGAYICWWDGSAFKSFENLGAIGLNNGVASIDINPNGTIIIGGDFTNAGGDPNANYVAEWHGNNWGSLAAGGLNSYVRKVYCADNGDIYIGGFFTQAGNLQLTDRIVKSTQGTYQSLDIELPGIEVVNTILSASDGSLYIGGRFSTTAASENAETGLVALNLNVASASANTYPFIQIHGPGTLKAITNYTTGKSVMFDGLTLQTGEWINLSFDPLNLQFKGGWEGRGNLMRYVVPGSDYGDFYLKPGINHLSVFMDDTNANSRAFIFWRPKFWGLDGAVYE
jgi:hypothetical protein